MGGGEGKVQCSACLEPADLQDPLQLRRNRVLHHQLLEHLTEGLVRADEEILTREQGRLAQGS